MIHIKELEIEGQDSGAGNFALGKVQFVRVAENIWVANMIAQRDIKRGKYSAVNVSYPLK